MMCYEFLLTFLVKARRQTGSMRMPLVNAMPYVKEVLSAASSPDSVKNQQFSAVHGPTP